MTNKRKRVYESIIVGLSIILMALCAYMGITAIQKSMTLKMQFSAEPTVACEFAIRQADSTEAYNPIFKNYEGTTISNGVSLTQNILRFTGGDYATATGTAIDLQYTNATTKCSAIKLTITGATVNSVDTFSTFIPKGNTATIENISCPAGGTIEFAMEHVAEITFNLSYAQVSSVNGLTLKPNTTNTYYAVYGTEPSVTLVATDNHMNPPDGVSISNGLGTYTKNATDGIVEFDSISQDITVTVANSNMQTYAIATELTSATISNYSTPTHGQDFTFTVTIDNDCTQVEVSYKIGNGEYTILDNPSPSGKSYAYTIAGANVTNDLTIKAVGSSSYSVTFANMVDCTATNTTLLQNQDLLTTITPTTSFAENYFDYQITINGEEYTHYGHSGTLKIPAEDINGNIEISVKVSECWDGGISSDSYSVGASGENLTYSITSPKQLAKLASLINADDSLNYRYTTFNIDNDLNLNDEDFVFDKDAGLVYVTDGVNEVWLGTGITGDDSGENTTFDTEPSEAGKFYDSKTSRTYTEPAITYDDTGVLKQWVPLGNSQSIQCSGIYQWQNHNVNGLYINSTEDRKGLYGNTQYSYSEKKYTKIYDLNVSGGYVKGKGAVAGCVGYGDNALVKNCSNACTVIGVNDVAGVFGSGGTVTSSHNTGTIIGSGSRVGGVGGGVYCGDDSGSTNSGDIYGVNYVGGVYGDYKYDLYSCVNTGKVSGVSYVGGLCGYRCGHDSTLEDNNCISSGVVCGTGEHVGVWDGYFYRSKDPI